MNEFDIFSSGMSSGDPSQMAGAAGSMFGADADSPYRYTGRYGSLMDSYQQRSRIVAREQLRNEMNRYEASRIMSMTRSVLNSGAQELTDEQRSVFEGFQQNGVTYTGIRALSMLGYSIPTDTPRAALGIDSALSHMSDPLTGMPMMDSLRRAKIASQVATNLYAPGQGRSLASGLSGEDMNRLAQSMGQNRELIGGASVEAELEQFMRSRPDVLTGGKYGTTNNMKEAERLDRMTDLAAKKAAATDPNASQAQLDEAAAAYTEAVTGEVSKRIADNLRERGKSVSIIQRHFKNFEGREIKADEAREYIEAITGGTSMMSGGQAANVTARMSQLSQSTGLSMDQITMLAQRGRQFVDAGPMKDTGLGVFASLSAGNVNQAQQNLGVFAEGAAIFGVGSANIELEEETAKAAAFAGSGMNQAKIAMYRLRSQAGGLEEGRVKSLLDKLDNGGRLSEDDMKLLQDPAAVQREMMAAAPGFSSSGIAGIIRDTESNAEFAFHNREEAMAGQRDIQTSETRAKLNENIANAVRAGQSGGQGTVNQTSLSEAQQNSVVQRTLEQALQLTPEQISVLSNQSEEGMNLGMQLAKQSLLDAMDAGDISMSDDELNQAARATFLQLQRGLAATSGEGGYGASTGELLVDLNEGTQRGAYRQDKVQRILGDMQEQASAISGEGGLVGAMAMLESADLDGTGVDMTKIGAALLSGAADEKHTGLVEKTRDKLADRLKGLSSIDKEKLNKTDREQLEDDIAVTKGVLGRVNEALKYDQKDEAGKSQEEKNIQEFGPGAKEGSGAMQLSNVTININGQAVVTSGNGSASYGGKTAIPSSKVD